MEVLETPTYSDNVYHLTMLFRKVDKAGFVGEWSTEWREMTILLHKRIQQILANELGILSVNITKLEPLDGYIFRADITYWSHP